MQYTLCYVGSQIRWISVWYHMYGPCTQQQFWHSRITTVSLMTMVTDLFIRSCRNACSEKGLFNIAHLQTTEVVQWCPVTAVTFTFFLIYKPGWRNDTEYTLPIKGFQSASHFTIMQLYRKQNNYSINNIRLKMIKQIEKIRIKEINTSAYNITIMIDSDWKQWSSFVPQSCSALFCSVKCSSSLVHIRPV